MTVATLSEANFPDVGNILTLPGVAAEPAQDQPVTRAQLQVRVAALERECARMVAFINDPRHLTTWALRLMNGERTDERGYAPPRRR